MKTKRYSKQGLWTLFLMCAFPLHLWTLILAFRDFSWVAERTNAWDALGVMSYGLFFVFLESLIVWLIATALGLFLSVRWDEPHRIAVLGVLVLVAASWAIGGQAYFVWGLSPSTWLVEWSAGSGHPLRLLYGLAIACVSISLFVPALLVLKMDRFHRFVQEILDRLALLAQFYLLLDGLGVVIILLRNIAGRSL